jgi:hypothetical protein
MLDLVNVFNYIFLFNDKQNMLTYRALLKHGYVSFRL